MNNLVFSPYIIPGLFRPQKPEAKNEKALKIINLICFIYGVDSKILCKNNRRAINVYVRDWCMWFIRSETNLALREIGTFFNGRDHTTVIHSNQKVKGQLTAKHDNKYKEDYEYLRQKITQINRDDLINELSQAKINSNVTLENLCIQHLKHK